MMCSISKFLNLLLNKKLLENNYDNANVSYVFREQWNSYHHEKIAEESKRPDSDRISKSDLGSIIFLFFHVST
jgi:hypothetical protein